MASSKPNQLKPNQLVNGYRYQDCRLLGHNWKIIQSDWTPTVGYPMTLACSGCGCQRRDQFNPNNGRILRRNYTHPDGYLFHRDTDGEILPVRVDFRLSWLERQIETMQEEHATR